MEIERIRDDLMNDLDKSLPSLFVAIFNLFSRLEASIFYSHENCRRADGSFLLPLTFARLPKVRSGSSNWTDRETRDAFNLIYENLHKLDFYLSVIVSENRKPRKVTLRWMRYSFGLVGIPVCCLLLLRHSRLMGNPDIDNLFYGAKDTINNFLKATMFETFTKRLTGVIIMDHEVMPAADDSLDRTVLAHQCFKFG